jgi:hypothetical protein
VAAGLTVSWRDRQAATYPDDAGVVARMMQMPVQAPDRSARPRKRRPVRDCEDCTGKPCQRHSYNLLASIGSAPAESPSADEYVHDWKAV